MTTVQVCRLCEGNPRPAQLDFDLQCCGNRVHALCLHTIFRGQDISWGAECPCCKVWLNYELSERLNVDQTRRDRQAQAERRAREQEEREARRQREHDEMVDRTVDELMRMTLAEREAPDVQQQLQQDREVARRLAWELVREQSEEEERREGVERLYRLRVRYWEDLLRLREAHERGEEWPWEAAQVRRMEELFEALRGRGVPGPWSD